LAKLIHVTRGKLAAAAETFDPVPEAGPQWKARRPSAGSALDPWFELTTASPWIDTRVVRSDSPGVAAALETYGGLTGPEHQAESLEPADQREVVLGGNAVAPGSPPPTAAADFRRQCAARLAFEAEGLGGERQCLVLFALRGRDGPVVQSFAGLHPIGETSVHGAERLAILVDVPVGGQLALDLWLRLAATHARSVLGVRGVQVYLL
jgi:hypothetical protein